MYTKTFKESSKRRVNSNSQHAIQNQISEIKEEVSEFPTHTHSYFKKQDSYNQNPMFAHVTMTPDLSHQKIIDQKMTCSTLTGSSISPLNFYSPSTRNLTDSFENDKASHDSPMKSPPKKSSLGKIETSPRNTFTTPKKNKKIEDFETTEYYQNAPRKHNNDPIEFSPTAVKFSKDYEF